MIADKKAALAIEQVQEVNGELERFPVRTEHVKILEESLAEYECNPQNVIPWEENKKRYLRPR